MIVSFTGENKFLSNFFPCDIGPFPSVENAYVAAKLKGTHPILLTCSPGKAKRYGREHELVPEWSNEVHRVNIMRQLLHVKFSHVPLKNALLATGEVLIVEGNTWNDTFWGQCPVGNGKNWLGNILMEIRDELSGKAFF
jgi:ribA/ribD-fused uncharacterized protein